MLPATPVGGAFKGLEPDREILIFFCPAPAFVKLY
jgi:hypothetical protein